jgi:Flp pilus assembly protein protease CpaA
MYSLEYLHHVQLAFAHWQDIKTEQINNFLTVYVLIWNTSEILAAQFMLIENIGKHVLI